MNWDRIVSFIYGDALLSYIAVMFGAAFHWLPPLLRCRRLRQWKDSELMALGLTLLCFGPAYVRGWYAVSRWLGNPDWMYQHWSTVAAVAVSAAGAKLKLWGLWRAVRRRLPPGSVRAMLRGWARACWLRALVRFRRVRRRFI